MMVKYMATLQLATVQCWNPRILVSLDHLPLTTIQRRESPPAPIHLTIRSLTNDSDLFTIFTPSFLAPLTWAVGLDAQRGVVLLRTGAETATPTPTTTRGGVSVKSKARERERAEDKKVLS